MIRAASVLIPAAMLLVAPLVAAAQPAGPVPRIGFLSIGSSTPPPANQVAFWEGLRELGYVEGQNIVSERRYAAGVHDRLPNLAAALVRLQVNVIVTTGTQATRAAQRATQTIPIVMAVSGDPVMAGFVSSLARPGGNITGLTNLSRELNGKRLELLKNAVPTVSRVGILADPTVAGYATLLYETREVAQALGMQPQFLEVRTAAQIDQAFRTASEHRVDALLVLPSSLINTQSRQLADLEARSQLPAISPTPEHAEAGGLMAYGPSYPDLFRRAATYVDKILRGAKPADLPVEQPMKFELVINLKTAQTLGITIPPALLFQATEVLR